MSLRTYLLMDHETESDQDIHALTEAFELFSEVSGKLDRSWRSLEEQVASLQAQLATARRERDAETERKSRLADRLRTVLETLPGGLVVLDEDQRVTESNRVAEHMFGEGLSGAAWDDVSGRAFRGRGGDQADYLLADGRRLQLAQRPIACDEGRRGRVLLFTDVTEQRKIEELLDRHRRLASLGEMAAALAHQVRTPLSSALLYASNARRPELSEEYRIDLLDKSVRCLKDLEQLVSDMLRFARGEHYIEQRFHVHELLAALGTAVAPVLGDHQQLTIDTPPGALSLAGNREALGGALINLVRNALQAAGDRARVRVTTEVNSEKICLLVSDNGPGVDPAREEKIFEPFETSRSDGTGLGLAVVRSVARAHGGDAVLRTNTPDGATFEIWLPLSQGENASDGTERPGVAA